MIKRKSKINRIIAFDPGGHTGFAWIVGPESSVSKGTLVGNHHKYLLEMLHNFAPETIVYERFDYRKNVSHAELTSVEYIGILKLYSQMTNCILVPQMQLKGKNGLWTDDKLKALQLYTVNGDHANDAVRQLLYYITAELKDNYWVKKYKQATQ